MKYGRAYDRDVARNRPTIPLARNVIGLERTDLRDRGDRVICWASV